MDESINVGLPVVSQKTLMLMQTFRDYAALEPPKHCVLDAEPFNERSVRIMLDPYFRETVADKLGENRSSGKRRPKHIGDSVDLTRVGGLELDPEFAKDDTRCEVQTPIICIDFA